LSLKPIETTQRVPLKVLMLSRGLEECKPLNPGRIGEDCSIDRFNLTLPTLLERVGSPFTNNTKFADNLDIVMSYKAWLTLVHFSAQPEPFMVTKATASPLLSAQPETFLASETFPHVQREALTASRKVDVSG